MVDLWIHRRLARHRGRLDVGRPAGLLENRDAEGEEPDGTGRDPGESVSKPVSLMSPPWWWEAKAAARQFVGTGRPVPGPVMPLPIGTALERREPARDVDGGAGG